MSKLRNNFATYAAVCSSTWLRQEVAEEEQGRLQLAGWTQPPSVCVSLGSLELSAVVQQEPKSHSWSMSALQHLGILGDQAGG